LHIVRLNDDSGVKLTVDDRQTVPEIWASEAVEQAQSVSRPDGVKSP